MSPQPDLPDPSTSMSENFQQMQEFLENLAPLQTMLQGHRSQLVDLGFPGDEAGAITVELARGMYSYMFTGMRLEAETGHIARRQNLNAAAILAKALAENAFPGLSPDESTT